MLRRPSRRHLAGLLAAPGSLPLLLAVATPLAADPGGVTIAEGSAIQLGSGTIGLTAVRPDEYVATIVTTGRIRGIDWRLTQTVHNKDMLGVGAALVPLLHIVAAAKGQPGHMEIAPAAGWVDADALVVHEGDAIRLTDSRNGAGADVTVGRIRVPDQAWPGIRIAWRGTGADEAWNSATMRTGDANRFGPASATVTALYGEGDGIQPHAVLKLAPAR